MPIPKNQQHLGENETELGAAVYEKGYRFRVSFALPDTTAPLYFKTLTEIRPLILKDFPNAANWHFCRIGPDGTGQLKLSDEEYFEWRNDYLTVETFAEHKGLNVNDARRAIQAKKQEIDYAAAHSTARETFSAQVATYLARRNMLEENKFQYDYMLLSRLQTDCAYYLRHPHIKHLWATTIDDQIAEMRKLWNKVDEKPKWLSMEQIDEYETKMKEIEARAK